MIGYKSKVQSGNLGSLAAAIDFFKIIWSDSGGYKESQETILEAILCAVFASAFELKQNASNKESLAIMFQDSSDAWWRFMKRDEEEKGKNYLTNVETRY